MAHGKKVKNTYRSGQLDAEARRHEAQNDAADGDAQPEASGRHTAGEVASLAHVNHKLDDPATQGDLDADVAKQKCGSSPRDAGAGAMEKYGGKAVVVFAGIFLVLERAVGSTVGGPKGVCCCGQFDDRNTNLSKRISIYLVSG